MPKPIKMVALNADIEAELDERIQREVIRRGGRYGQKRLVIIEALEKGLELIEQQRREPQALAS